VVNEVVRSLQHVPAGVMPTPSTPRHRVTRRGAVRERLHVKAKTSRRAGAKTCRMHGAAVREDSDVAPHRRLASAFRLRWIARGRGSHVEVEHPGAALHTLRGEGLVLEIAGDDAGVVCAIPDDRRGRPHEVKPQAATSSSASTLSRRTSSLAARRYRASVPSWPTSNAAAAIRAACAARSATPRLPRSLARASGVRRAAGHPLLWVEELGGRTAGRIHAEAYVGPVARSRAE